VACGYENRMECRAIIELAIVEQNAAWGSGLYGCDPIRVLEVLRYASVTNTI
jgi:hypothetical protein